jgi:hypothetical protein
MRCAGGGDGEGTIATGVGLGLGTGERVEGEEAADCGPPQAITGPLQAITRTATIAQVALFVLTRHGP